MPPRITQSAMLEQWARANELAWTTDVVKCTSCTGDFTTGDLFFSFPAGLADDEVPAIVAQHARPTSTGRTRYFCVRCSHAALGAGQRFDGAGVFVESAHQSRIYDELPKTVQERLLEAFTLLDQLHANLAAVARGQPIPEPS